MARGKDIMYVVFAQGGVPVYLSRSCSKACNFALELVEDTALIPFNYFKRFEEKVRKLRKGEIEQLGVRTKEGNNFAYVRRFITNTDYSKTEK